MHVSTAYVAGNTKGDAPETPPGTTTPNGTPLDAREEVLNLEAVVAEVDRASQERALLRRFETEARRELGMVGEEDEVAERVDKLRRAWMRERLVERGTQRARELGWNDVYTFTKSLAERMVLRERGETPLVILRPAIIESSHREPYPGWIQGSRMADPIIMAFAKGILREFPGDPKSFVDIVPVDHVVNAILAARRPPSRRARGLPGRLRRAQPDSLPRPLRDTSASTSSRTPCATPAGALCRCRSGASPGAGGSRGGSRRSLRA